MEDPEHKRFSSQLSHRRDRSRRPGRPRPRRLRPSGRHCYRDRGHRGRWRGQRPGLREQRLARRRSWARRGGLVETRETELLIIGAGTAVAAVATAADLGLDFTWREKTGLHPAHLAWFGAINSKYTKAAGAEVDTAKLLNEFTRYASGQADQRVVRVWIDEAPR